mgnify:CR=1 FL=1
MFYLLKKDKNFLTEFGHAILQARDKLQKCEKCGTISDDKLCSICANKNRQTQLICVVAEITDISALEKSGEFNGVYHVLGGTINSTEGVTPEILNIKKLDERILRENISEIILALNATIEGETTSMHLSNLLKKYPNLKITKLARGLPQGSDLEYADEITLANAFKGRIQIGE